MTSGENPTPPPDAGNGIGEVLAKCARLAKRVGQGRPRENELDTLALAERDIQRAWKPLRRFAAAKLSAEAVDAEPGYVRQDGVLVPFYLLQDVPGPSELRELLALALTVRVADDGVICLSGSTALLHALAFVGDIDFCEYAPDAGSAIDDIVDRVNRHALRATAPLCGRVKVVGSPSWEKRCPEEWEKDVVPAELRQRIATGSFQLKLDFLADTTAVGTVEATNMVLLLLDPARLDEIVAVSFAAQEVPVDGMPLPRRLTDPLQLGRYINFLVEQTEAHLQDAPVKALKRGLSLVRILMLKDWDTRLLALLRDKHGALASAIEARTGLKQRLSAKIQNGDQRRALADLFESLDVTIQQLEAKRGDPADHPAAAPAAEEWIALKVVPELTILVGEAKALIDGR